MLVTDAEWLAVDGPIGCYSSGNGSSTFRLPLLGGHFLRAWVSGQTQDAGRAAGRWQQDAIRNVAGTFTAFDNAPNTTGAFSIGSLASASRPRSRPQRSLRRRCLIAATPLPGVGTALC